MSIMRDIGRQIGHQKTAIRLPGMKPPRAQGLGAMTLKMPAKTGPRPAGPGPAAAQAPAPSLAARPSPGGAAQQGLMGLLRDPRVRGAAGTVGQASKIGIPGGILANRLIAALAAQNRMEGSVNESAGRR